MTYKENYSFNDHLVGVLCQLISLYWSYSQIHFLMNISCPQNCSKEYCQ